MNQGRSVSYMKMEVRDVLRTETPNGWSRLINRRIKKLGMRYWMGSIAVWNYPKHAAWQTKLDELSSWYRADLNTNTSTELEEAFTLLGWPYRKGASDDAVPSAIKKAISHNDLTSGQRVGHPDARKYMSYNQSEAGRAS